MKQLTVLLLFLSVNLQAQCFSDKEPFAHSGKFKKNIAIDA
jgi:hypothetical protein